MQDREPTYPGRVTLTPVYGLANTYDMERADRPLQQGTPLNKASLLKDATAALFGLGTDAVPDDAFHILSRFQSGLGNEYIWKKIKTISEEIPVYSTSTDSNYYILSVNQTITCGTGFHVENNKFVIDNPTSIYLTTSNYNTVAGKYCLRDSGTVVVYSPLGSSLYVDDVYIKSSFFYRYASPSSTQSTKIENYGYVNSPNSDAYPPAVSDGYTYIPLGKLCDNVIDTGSYVGTGTGGGTSNANKIIFNFEPKLVIVYPKDSGLMPYGTQYWSKGFIWLDGQNLTYVQSTKLVFIKSENTLIWFADSANASGAQQNGAGITYSYIAIG